MPAFMFEKISPEPYGALASGATAAATSEATAETTAETTTANPAAEPPVAHKPRGVIAQALGRLIEARARWRDDTPLR